MFLRSQSKAVHVNALIGVTSVRLVRLDPREVGSFALREAILSVELELGSDAGVLSPTVHVKGGLRENEGTGIRDSGSFSLHCANGGLSKAGGAVGGGVGVAQSGAAKIGLIIRIIGAVPISSEVRRDVCIKGTSLLEEAVGVNERVLANEGSRTGTSDFLGSTKGVDRVGKSVNGVSVVEGLGAKNLEEEGIASEGRAIVNVLIGLDDPDELLHGMVEVELDLVGGRTNGLVTSELELGDEVLVGVLCHTTTLVGVKEHVVNVEGSSNKGLVVRNGGRDGATSGGLNAATKGAASVAAEGGDGPEALVNGADIKVDLYFVVLYEPLIPPLSRYLSAVSLRSTITKMRLLQGTRLYLKSSMKLIRLLRPITI
jgi:hypothetical protein